ncbi:MAG: hypothetical protein IJN15_01575 [Clostridia bacterium]|nr:hypothetical protein [Clostridia bacterium]
MEKFSLKRTLTVVTAFALCLVIAIASIAVSSASGTSTSRTITVNTGSVIQDSYEGLGDNLWCGPYYYGMNDAYQRVNDKRSAVVEPAFMRMMFYPQWIVYLDKTPEEQEYYWNNGIYNFDTVEYKNFVIRVKMLKEAGTIIQLNFGGIVAAEMQEWFGIPGSSRYGSDGTRAAPKNLEAFAQAAYELWYQLYYVEGLTNVTNFSFYNEVNGANYETILDKRVYYSRMVLEVHNKFVEEGKRNLVRICGTDFSAWWNEETQQDGIISFFNVAREEQVDSKGNNAYDYLSNHTYLNGLHNFTIGMDLKDGYNLYQYYLEEYKVLTRNVPDIYITEFSGYPSRVIALNAEPKKCLEFAVNEASMVIAQSNAGVGGSARWFFMGEYIPKPTSVGHNGRNSDLWNTPSLGLDQVSDIYAYQGLLMRYIPKKSQVVTTNCDSEDIIAATYLKGSDITVLTEVKENSAVRNLTVNIGSKAANKQFQRIVYYYPVDIENVQDENGNWNDEDDCADTGRYYPDGDLLPVADKVVTANSSGVITDTLPENQHMLVIYTTLDEEVQVVTGEEKAEVEMKKGENKTFSVDAIYGTKDGSGTAILNGASADLSNVTWEIWGKNDYVAAGDGTAHTYYGGYGWTQKNVGKIVANGSSATYIATSNELNVGDTVAIKVTSKYDTSAYTVIIVKIVE